MIRLRFIAHLGRAAAAASMLWLAVPALAVDPPYHERMQRLTEIMGSLYFLQPLCGFHTEDWRLHAAELIEFDEPDPDRRERLIGAFNSGYEGYARLYRLCTSSAREAMTRLLIEAEAATREIHARFAE